MNQRWLPWFGGFLLVVSQALVLLFGLDGLAQPRVALQYAVMTLSALLLLAAGLRERYAFAGVGVRWHQLCGTSMVLLGFGLAASYLLSILDGATGTERVFLAIAAVGSLTLVWFGYQVAYATRHVRLEPDPYAEE